MSADAIEPVYGPAGWRTTPTGYTALAFPPNHTTGVAGARVLFSVSEDYSRVTSVQWSLSTSPGSFSPSSQLFPYMDAGYGSAVGTGELCIALRA